MFSKMMTAQKTSRTFRVEGGGGRGRGKKMLTAVSKQWGGGVHVVDCLPSQHQLGGHP